MITTRTKLARVNGSPLILSTQILAPIASRGSYNSQFFIKADSSYKIKHGISAYLELKNGIIIVAEYQNAERCSKLHIIDSLQNKRVATYLTNRSNVTALVQIDEKRIAVAYEFEKGESAHIEILNISNLECPEVHLDIDLGTYQLGQFIFIDNFTWVAPGKLLMRSSMVVKEKPKAYCLTAIQLNVSAASVEVAYVNHLISDMFYVTKTPNLYEHFYVLNDNRALTIGGFGLKIFQCDEGYNNVLSAKEIMFPEEFTFPHALLLKNGQLLLIRDSHLTKTTDCFLIDLSSVKILKELALPIGDMFGCVFTERADGVIRFFSNHASQLVDLDIANMTVTVSTIMDDRYCLSKPELIAKGNKILLKNTIIDFSQYEPTEVQQRPYAYTV